MPTTTQKKETEKKRISKYFENFKKKNVKDIQRVGGGLPAKIV